ncbi:MAG: response regulator [Lewinellaceae bacterium]|nr:response regulator [Lewinellaceae bacterium]
MQFKAEEKGLELKTHIPENMPLVLGDPTRLRQILINLVGNAIKFTEKGIITISVRQEDVQADEKPVFHFTVSDTGIGIGSDRLEKIFESFEQAYSDTSRKFGGTGLGLSISKTGRIARWSALGGKRKGKGSYFHFTIPYAIVVEEQAAIADSTNDLAETAKALKGVRILLVEDNAFNALVAQEELEDAIEGVDLTLAENGAIAVEKARHGDFDIILMDVQMPVMNGYEATEKIRALDHGKARIPIIAMTANVLKDEVERCYEAGMDDFCRETLRSGRPFIQNEQTNLEKTMKVHLQYILIVVVCLLFAGMATAQQSRADSLFAIWSDKTNSDEARVEAFYQRFNPLVDETYNPEAVRWAPGLQEAMALAPKTGKQQYMGRFLTLASATQLILTKNWTKPVLLVERRLPSP